MLVVVGILINAGWIKLDETLIFIDISGLHISVAPVKGPTETLPNRNTTV